MKFPKCFLVVFLLAFQLNVWGQTVNLKLENVPTSTTCSDIWTEENLNLSFVPTTPDDCTSGSCFFGIEPTFVWLFPSRLTVDLSTLQNIHTIEVHVIDFCDVNCTQAFIADSSGMVLANTGNTIISSQETLTLLNPTEEPLTELAISSCEGQILEIRISYSIIESTHSLSESNIVSFPNPGSAADDLHFQVINNAKWASPERVDIFNLNGQQVYSKTINSPGDFDGLTIPAADLPKGVFIVRFKVGEQFFRQRIIRL